MSNSAAPSKKTDSTRVTESALERDLRMREQRRRNLAARSTLSRLRNRKSALK